MRTMQVLGFISWHDLQQTLSLFNQHVPPQRNRRSGKIRKCTHVGHQERIHRRDFLFQPQLWRWTSTDSSKELAINLILILATSFPLSKVDTFPWLMYQSVKLLELGLEARHLTVSNFTMSCSLKVPARVSCFLSLAGRERGHVTESMFLTCYIQPLQPWNGLSHTWC